MKDLYDSYGEYELNCREVWFRYIKYFPVIKKAMNECLDVKYGDQYWKILIGKWLVSYLYLFVNVYSCFNKKKEVLLSINYLQENNFSDMRSLRNYVYDCTLKNIMEKQICFFKDRANSIRNNHNTPRVEFKKTFYRKKNKIKENAVSEELLLFADGYNRKSMTYILKKNNVSILRRCGHNKPISNIDIDWRERIFLTHDFDDDLDYIFWNTMVWNFPIALLEDYKNNCKYALDLYTDKSYGTIFVQDFSNYYYVLRDYFIAYQVEKYSASIVSVQHGGVYGMNDLITNIPAMFEYDVCDKFVSYGWGEEKWIYPMPSLLSIKNYGKVNPGQNILYLTTVNAYFRGAGGGYAFGRQYCDYIVRFFNKVNKCKLCLTWRSYDSRLKNSCGDIKKYVQQHVMLDKQIIAVDPPGTFEEQLRTARIVVIDHCSTTMLQTIALGIPTILFWNKDNNKLTKDAQYVMKELDRVGIFHDTPESAILFINNIYLDVYSWWNSKEVVAARKLFCDKFSKISNNPQKEYIDMFVSMKHGEMINHSNIDMEISFGVKIRFYLEKIAEAIVIKKDNFLHKFK